MKVWLATTKEFNGVVDNFREEQNRFHIKEDREAGTVRIVDATTGKTVFMGLQKDSRTWIVRYDPTYFEGNPSSGKIGNPLPDIKIWNDIRDSRAGELFGSIFADDTAKNVRVGRIDYSEFENVLRINLITVIPEYQRQGIARAMLDKLHAEFPEDTIDTGFTTEEGTALLEGISTSGLPILPKSGPETEMVIKITDPNNPEDFTIFYDLTDRKREHLRRSYTKRGWIIEEFERPISERKSSSLNSVSISWDPEFDQESIEIISPFIPKAQEEIQRRAGRPLDFPPKVFAMTRGEVVAGRLVGAGHGMFIRPSTIKVNPSLPPIRLLANYIHENLHWALPSMSEHQVDILTDEILQSIGAPGLNSASNDGQLTIEGVLERYG